MAAITPQFLTQARSHWRPHPIFELISTAPLLAADIARAGDARDSCDHRRATLRFAVGTTLSLGQTFTILNKASTGLITGTFAGDPQGGTVTGSNGTVFSVSYIGGDGGDRRRSHGDPGTRSRIEHMDRRCVCDGWARFHAALQTAEVDSAALRGWNSFREGCPRSTLTKAKEATDSVSLRLFSRPINDLCCLGSLSVSQWRIRHLRRRWQ